MELGSLVWFSSHEHPFAVRERHCLDLECDCTDAWLTLTEVNLAGQELREPLTFEIRVDLRTGRERRPPKRSAEIQALVREFLVCFPAERFQEMVTRHHDQRTAQRQLAEYVAEPSSRGELLSYSDVVYAGVTIRVPAAAGGSSSVAAVDLEPLQKNLEKTLKQG